MACMACQSQDNTLAYLHAVNLVLESQASAVTAVTKNIRLIFNVEKRNRDPAPPELLLYKLEWEALDRIMERFPCMQSLILKGIGHGLMKNDDEYKQAILQRVRERTKLLMKWGY